MDLNQMVIFAKVVELSSFTKAARELGMEKSNVSQKISSLEARLGVRLLNRTTRSVSATEAGEGYYQYCAEIVERINEADSFAESLTAEPRGTITVTAPSNLGPFISRSLIIPFMEKYQKIMFSLNLTNRKIDLIGEGYDLAIRGDLSPPKDSSDIYRLITSSETGLYASEDYLKRTGVPKTVDALKDHEMIVFSTEEDFKKRPSLKCEYQNQEIRIVPRFRFRVNDLMTCADFAMSGQGIALIPTRFIQPDIRRQNLKPVLPELKFSDARVYAVYPSSRLKSAKIRAFLEYLTTWDATTS